MSMRKHLFDCPVSSKHSLNFRKVLTTFPERRKNTHLLIVKNMNLNKCICNVMFIMANVNKQMYKVFIKNCVFSLEFCDFSELCQFCCSAGFLPAWCVYTLTPKKNRARNIFK